MIYTLHQILRSGEHWTSPESFTGDERHAAQNVIAGFLTGEPRWAVDAQTGRFIYGLDARGRDMKGAP